MYFCAFFFVAPFKTINLDWVFQLVESAGDLATGCNATGRILFRLGALIT
jgi:hypothetical protein